MSAYSRISAQSSERQSLSQPLSQSDPLGEHMRNVSPGVCLRPSEARLSSHVGGLRKSISAGRSTIEQWPRPCRALAEAAAAADEANRCRTSTQFHSRFRKFRQVLRLRSWGQPQRQRPAGQKQPGTCPTTPRLPRGSDLIISCSSRRVDGMDCERRTHTFTSRQPYLLFFHSGFGFGFGQRLLEAAAASVLRTAIHHSHGYI